MTLLLLLLSIALLLLLALVVPPHGHSLVEWHASCHWLLGRIGLAVQPLGRSTHALLTRPAAGSVAHGCIGGYGVGTRLLLLLLTRTACGSSTALGRLHQGCNGIGAGRILLTPLGLSPDVLRLSHPLLLLLWGLLLLRWWTSALLLLLLGHGLDRLLPLSEHRLDLGPLPRHFRSLRGGRVPDVITHLIRLVHLGLVRLGRTPRITHGPSSSSLLLILLLLGLGTRLLLLLILLLLVPHLLLHSVLGLLHPLSLLEPLRVLHPLGGYHIHLVLLLLLLLWLSPHALLLTCGGIPLLLVIHQY